ncbi:MAG: type III polyketide synthase [Gammaproteobacteria bacterium]|nr:type III polyketide synthase [Gammaproteobacteria bacterium]
MEIGITGIGIANPIYKQNQERAVELVGNLLQLNSSEKKLLRALYKFTGIKYRYSVLADACKIPGEFEFFPNNENETFPTTAARMQIYKDNALTLALVAIQNCLIKIQGFNKQDITHLVTVSCTGMYAPGLDIELVQQLGLKSNTKRTAINFMGCYGAFNGIKIADAICRADKQANVLVVCVEICTIHFQNKKDLDNLTSNAIFADGASCVLIQGEPKQNKYLGLTAFHCDLLPSSQQEMAWHIGDSGFDMILTSYVPEAIASGIPFFVKELMKNLELTLEDIDYYAIHPGAKKILKACEKSLGINALQNRYSYNILENYGNMSSVTILFVLNLIWEDISLPEHHNKTIFGCAFGPGLTLESMLLKTHYV